MARQATVTIEVQADEAVQEAERLENGLEDVNVAAVEADEGMRRIEVTSAEVGEEMKTAGNAVDRFTGKNETMRHSASAAANNLGLELTQAVQDSRHSMSGLANQIPLISTQFSQLTAKTGSATGALSALTSSFLGPTGVIAGVTLLLAYKDDILSFFTDTEQSASDAAEEFEGFASTVDSVEQSLSAVRERFKEVEGFSFDLGPGRPDGEEGPVPGPVPGQDIPEEQIQRFRDLLSESSDASRLLESQLRALEGFDFSTVLTGSLSDARDELARFEEQINQILSDPTGAIQRRPKGFAQQIEREFQRIQFRQQQLVEQGLRDQEDAIQRQVDFLRSALTQASDALTEDQFNSFFASLQSRLTDLEGQLEDNTEEQERQLTALEKQQEKVSELRKQVKMLSRVEGQRLAQARRTKEELKQETEALREHNRLMATGFDQTQEQRRREAAQAGLDALGEATMPDPEEAESKFDQLASHLGQAVKAKRFGFDGVGNQIGQQLIQNARQALIKGEISEEAFQNLKQVAEDAGIELEDQVRNGISAGAQASVQTLSALMSTAISEITRDIENKWARAITNAAAQALSSEVVKRLRGVLSGVSVAGGGGGGSGSGSGGGAGGAGAAASGTAAGSSSLAAGLGGAAAGFGVGNILGRVVRPDKNEGAALGSLGGAGVGAILGSVVPGIGTAIGGLVGGGLGGLLAGSFAEGGKVRGPGGPTDDQIPALLSHREFVMQAESAMQAPTAMEAMNENPALAGMVEQMVVGQSPEEFASGGFAVASAGPPSSTVQVEQGLQATPPKRELSVQLETEVKRINKRELGLLVRTENERRKRFQI
jgi:hypothetical protein